MRHMPPLLLTYSLPVLVLRTPSMDFVCEALLVGSYTPVTWFHDSMLIFKPHPCAALRFREDNDACTEQLEIGSGANRAEQLFHMPSGHADAFVQLSLTKVVALDSERRDGILFVGDIVVPLTCPAQCQYLRFRKQQTSKTYRNLPCDECNEHNSAK